MKIAIYNGYPFHYEDIGHISEYCKLRGHELTVYSNTEDSWGWFDYYGISPLPVNQYSHKDFDYVFLLTDDDWSFPVTPDEKIICIEHAAYQRRSGNIKRVTFKARPGVPFIFFTFSVPRAPKTLRICVVGKGKDVNVKYPVEVIHIHHGNPIHATEMIKVISSCQYMACLNYVKSYATPGAISLAFTCGCRLITNKTIIDEYGLKSAIDYEATNELVSLDPADVYEEAERFIANRNTVYDSLLSSNIFDFIEIGTSDFNTEIENAGPKRGISIEPVKHYLDALPNAINVMKIHGAVSNVSGTIDVYSITPDSIIKYNLPDWIRGCNCVNKIHPRVEGKVPDDVIVKETVPVYTFSDIVEMCHVDSCKYLKVDTEGHDPIIMQSYLDCVSKGFPLIPKIRFEDYGWSDKNLVDDVVAKCMDLGYTWTRDCEDIILTYDSPHDYDFIEIGTGDFDTEIENAGLKRGISIEPIKRYLDALPNPPYVTKIHGAVSNVSGTVNIYSISPENIEKYNLSYWLRGCNSVNTQHILWTGKVPDEIIIKDQVHAYTFTDVINMCNVKSCKYLKIDAEGHDTIILQSYLDCVSHGFPLIPKIQFEANEWTTQEQLDAILEKLVGLGYTYTRTPCGTNIILVR